MPTDEAAADFESALADPSLTNVSRLHDYVFSGTFEDRISMVENGVLDTLAKLLESRTNRPGDEARSQIWKWLHRFVIIDDLDDPRERGPGSTIDACQSRGVFSYLMEEFGGNGSPSAKNSVFGFVSWCAQDEAAIPALISTGIHREMIKAVNNRGQGESQAMAGIRALITLEGNPRKVIRADGGLDAVLPFLDDLKEKSDEDKIRRGFRTASIVARLAGNDEAGVGPQVLRGNPLLVQTLVTMLDKVIDAGATGMVYNMGINPHLITMDILVISASDTNKPLLARAVSVLYKALATRGDTVPKLVRDVVNIYVLLSFDHTCLAELQKLGRDKLMLFKTLIPTSDRESMASYENMMSLVFPSSAKKGGSLKGLVGKVMSSQKAVKGKSGGGRHVMLSYNWGVKPIVLHIDTMLKSRGIKTWVDEFDMGANINDSMATAVEGASFVMVFLSQKYKESGNCRRECEYADTAGVPIVYVMAEDHFKPSGWLALLMGKALYLTATSIEEAKENFDSILKRVSSNTSSTAPLLPSTPSPQQQPNEVVPTLVELTAKVDAMRVELNELKGVREEVKALQAEVQALQEK